MGPRDRMYISSERDITPQRQLDIVPLSAQALYFWSPVLTEKCQKAQILCIPPFSY